LDVLSEPDPTADEFGDWWGKVGTCPEELVDALARDIQHCCDLGHADEVEVLLFRHGRAP
jgi:hypothetical protein